MEFWIKFKESEIESNESKIVFKKYEIEAMESKIASRDSKSPKSSKVKSEKFGHKNPISEEKFGVRSILALFMALCLFHSTSLASKGAPENQFDSEKYGGTRISKKYDSINNAGTDGRFGTVGKYDGLGIDRVQHGMSVASGVGVSKIIPFRVGFQRSFGCRFCPKKTNEDWPVGGYWEASAYSMRSHSANTHNRLNSPKQMNAIALAGVLRVERRCPLEMGIWPYLDIGIGLSWISKKEISGRELGTRFQFEDRLGVGFRFGDKRQYDLSYRVIHFSNAYLDSRNAGVNLHLLVLGYWFG